MSVVLDDMNINPLRIADGARLRRASSSSRISARRSSPLLFTRADASMRHRISRTTRSCCSPRSTSSWDVGCVERHGGGRKILRYRSDDDRDRSRHQQVWSLTSYRSSRPTCRTPYRERSASRPSRPSTSRISSGRSASLRCSMLSEDSQNLWRRLRGRRKSVVMFSEGFNYQLTEPFGMRSVSDVLRATQDTLNAAARANVSFYTIDPRGLDGAGTDFMQMGRSGMPDGATQIAIREELQAIAGQPARAGRRNRRLCIAQHQLVCVRVRSSL